LLVRDVAKAFGGRVQVSVEEYGSSPMAQRFGVRRYPVVFVDDVLFARPKDFGFGGKEDVSGGLYVPWLDPANQRRFKDDLRHAVERRLAGEAIVGHDVADVATAADADEGPAVFPSLALTDVSGKTVAPARLADRAVVVEMWATWCPPCRSTLAWLPSLQKQYGNRLAVVTIAVDSAPADVAALAAKLGATYPVVMGTPEVVSAFGAVAAVPKLLVFDRRGRRSQVIYGAPPDLHRQIEAAVQRALR
jgi:thiol-disulfide isomerase/thioredoxin